MYVPGNDSKPVADQDSFLMTDDEESKILKFEDIDKILTENDEKNVLSCDEINELINLLNSIL